MNIMVINIVGFKYMNIHYYKEYYRCVVIAIEFILLLDGKPDFIFIFISSVHDLPIHMRDNCIHGVISTQFVFKK